MAQQSVIIIKKKMSTESVFSQSLTTSVMLSQSLSLITSSNCLSERPTLILLWSQQRYFSNNKLLIKPFRNNNSLLSADCYEIRQHLQTPNSESY